MGISECTLFLILWLCGILIIKRMFVRKMVVGNSAPDFSMIRQHQKGVLYSLSTSYSFLWMGLPGGWDPLPAALRWADRQMDACLRSALSRSEHLLDGWPLGLLVRPAFGEGVRSQRSLSPPSSAMLSWWHRLCAPFTLGVPSERKRLYRLVPWLILPSTPLRRPSHPVRHVLS